MDCPKCSRPLSRTTYENIRVMQCEDCLGYLVARNRLKLIKSSREQSPEALKNEVRAEQTPDTQERIRCPSCRVETMQKERVRITADDFFHLDVCRKCHNVWLDGGELARLQIQFEQSAKAVEEFARQDRLQDFTAEQRTEFQQRVDKLQDSESVFGTSVADLAFLSAGIFLLVATAGCLFFEYPVWSALFSLALCALLVYGAISRFEDTGIQRVLAICVVGLVEAVYLFSLLWFF
ncbi:MAG: zf-TFIIB domain-containing protein [Planctomycetota bacterium]